MANSFREFFGLVFPGLQSPPKNSRPKFTPKHVGIPLKFHTFSSPKSFHADFLLTGGAPKFLFAADLSFRILLALSVANNAGRNFRIHDLFGGARISRISESILGPPMFTESSQGPAIMGIY